MFRDCLNKAKEHLVTNNAVRNWCNCGWEKIIFFIKISLKYKVMFLISVSNLALTD